MTTYKTISGDTWDLISYKCYGTEKNSSKLMKANPKYIDIVIFSGNVELNVPKIDESISNDLPPWKKV